MYLFLKVTHLIAIFLFLTATSVTFFSEKDSVSFKIVAGVSGMIVLVTGLGLVLIVGSEVPFWVLVKFVIWLVLTGGGALVAKRFLKLRVPAYLILILLASTAAFLAIYKPTL